MPDTFSPETSDSPCEPVQVTTTMSRCALEIRCWLPEHNDAKPSLALLGHQLPRGVGATTVHGSIRILCLAPAEWLLISDEPLASNIIERGAAELAAQSAVLVDATDGTGVLGIRGPRARDVLSKGCGLDLRPYAFAMSRCARTRFAQMSVIIDHIDGSAGFRLYVARSYLRYLTDWVEDAAAEFTNIS